MTRTSSPALEVLDLEVGYGDVKVLNGVTLHVPADRVVAVVGPNGAGKSTLLRAICGLLRPVRGTVRLHGDGSSWDVTGLEPHRVHSLGVSFVPQSENVFPNLSVRDNLEVAAGARGAQKRRQIEAVLERWPWLKGRLRERAGALSGGERKMLALARGLMGDPRVLLLDEPSSGLAPREIERIFEEIRRLRQSRVALVIVEQNARRALELAERAYVLERGRIRAEGPGPELLQREDMAQVYLALGRPGGGVTPEP